MNRMMIALSILFCMFITARTVHMNPTQAEEPKAKLVVGQMWSYKARPQEEMSYFIIVKIDHDAKLGAIVHIAMRGLKMKNPRSPDGISDTVNHMPFTEEAVHRSALRLLKERVELPTYEKGYRMWREAFDADRAGVYTVSLAEAVKIMESTLNQ